MLTWFVGIILGIASVFGAIFLRDIGLFAASSYTSYLPSLYFIALNTAILALAESFGLAFFANRDETGHIVRLFVQFVALLIFVFAGFILYAKSVIRLSEKNINTDWFDVLTPFLIILIGGGIVASMKKALNKLTV